MFKKSGREENIAIKEGIVEEIQVENLYEDSVDDISTSKDLPNNDEIQQCEEGNNKCSCITCSLPSIPGWLKRFGKRLKYLLCPCYFLWYLWIEYLWPWLKAIALFALFKMVLGLSIYSYDIASKYS